MVGATTFVVFLGELGMAMGPCRKHSGDKGTSSRRSLYQARGFARGALGAAGKDAELTALA